MRDKADAVDYYYFPDPDLLPVCLTDDDIENVRKNMPELPEQKAERYTKLGMSQKEIDFLVQNANYSNYFDELLKKHDAKFSSTWMLTELLGRLSKMQVSIEECMVSANKLSELMDAIKNGEISGKIAKDVLDDMLISGKSASEIINEKGLKQIDDDDAIEKAVIEVINENPQQVEKYKNGNDRLFGFFVGQTLKKMGGKANPQKVNEIVKKQLG